MVRVRDRRAAGTMHAELALYHTAMAARPFPATAKALRRPTAKALRKLARSAVSVTDNGGPETIEGVTFDLRHPLLSPDEWRFNVFSSAIILAPGFGLADNFRDRPSIWFPWFGEIAAEDYGPLLERYRRSMLEYHASIGNAVEIEKLSARPIDDVIAQNSPECFIQSGDTIRICDVSTQRVGHELEHNHDSVINLAFIEVIRASGAIEKIKTPFRLIGQQIVLTDSEDSDYYFINILWRVVKFFNFNSLDELAAVSRDGKNETRAASIGRELLSLVEPLTDLRFEQSEAGRAAEVLHKAINDAAMFGFLWAKVESDTKLRPLAETALERRIANKAGGAASGNARRKKAEEGWIAIVKKMAVEIRQELPELSQDDLVYEIQDQWEAMRQRLLHNASSEERERIKGLKLCKHARLKQIISAMEKADELPRRKILERSASMTKGVQART